MKRLTLTKEQIAALLPKGWRVEMPNIYHGHDVWIYSPRNKLRARWLNGTTKHWRDQSAGFIAWANGGCRGNFAPTNGWNKLTPTRAARAAQQEG